MSYTDDTKHKPLALALREMKQRKINRGRSHSQYLLARLEFGRKREFDNRGNPKPKPKPMTEQLKAIWGDETESLQINQITASLKHLYGKQYFNAYKIIQNLEDKEYIEKTNVAYYKAPELIRPTKKNRYKSLPIPTIRLFFYYPTAKGLRVINPKPTDVLPTALKELNKDE